MSYCCSGFKNLISCAGNRGIAHIVWLDSRGEPRFVIQSRGLAFGDETKLKPIDVDVYINVSSEAGMRFCPACGRLLDELVRENRDFFIDLAKQHKKYVPNL